MKKEEEIQKIAAILFTVLIAPFIFAGFIIYIVGATPQSFLETCSIRERLKLTGVKNDEISTYSTFKTLRGEFHTYRTETKNIVAYLEDNDYNKEDCNWFDNQRVGK